VFSFKELKKVADYCKENRIDFKFIVPPIHETMWAYFDKKSLDTDKLLEYKRLLSWYAPIYDMEFESSIIGSSDFHDGHHFRGDVLQEYIKMITTGEGENVRVWKNGVIEEGG